MARLQTRDESTLSKDTISLLEPTKVNGQLADVYLQFANSEPALAAYMRMEESLRNGTLSGQELEAIKLAVSEHTQCDYCLSVHSMKARKAGLDAATQLAIRSGKNTGIDRIDIIIDIVGHFFHQRGPLPDAMITNAKKQGFTDTQLVDIAMAVSTIFFTNITNHINNTEQTLPAPPAITST